MLLHGRRNKRRRVAAVCRNLADSRRGDVCEVLARHHEERLDLGRHAPVRERHLELVLEVRVHAHAADDHARADLAAEVDEERVEDVHLDVGEPRLLHVLADHVDAVLRVEERARLRARRGHRHHETVVQARRARDQVEMTARHRVERARIDCYLLCHGE